MSLPVHDWQFWAVSGAALVALLWLLRAVLPSRLIPRRWRRRGQERRATLTIGGQKPADRR
jgi:hypothetical protein